MPSFKYKKTVDLLRQTAPGRERNMYSHLRDLFAHVLRHPSEYILIDAPQEGAGGATPDLRILADTGVPDPSNHRGGALLHDWIVLEAKDEKVFADPASREAVFSDKKKYIRPETEWFVMADPECLVIRPVAGRLPIDAEDRVYYWQTDLATPSDFCTLLHDLSAAQVVDSPALRAFRGGNADRIAVVRVSAPDDDLRALPAPEGKQLAEQLAQAKKDFLGVVRESTRILQVACKTALDELAPAIRPLAADADIMAQKWKFCRATYDPLEVAVDNWAIKSKEEKEEFDARAAALKHKMKNNLVIAKLALSALPAYHRRNPAKNGGKQDICVNTDRFAIESANLILARIMMLRFFEDHNFFGSKKYICNGGVAALQALLHYPQGAYADLWRALGLNETYGDLLRAAYRKGGEIYDAAFDETDFDWAINIPSHALSRAIELTMMRMSRFDFSSISGDILSGIYDRFLDKRQRKTLGEYYTPPSIARYIIRRLGIRPEHSVFDPACGSGTFLLEAFEHVTGGDIRNKRGLYAQAKSALARIGGNDLNPFSAVMTHIQMLWQLLPLKDDLKANGFPSIRATGGINAMLVNGEMHSAGALSLYAADLDRPAHHAVMGNPPYVRPERGGGNYDEDTQDFYAPIGGAQKNYYDLFVYRALAHWCRQPNGNGNGNGGDGIAGKLGFVLPLSFCDSGNSKPLRRLFEIGQRFRIIEIVDMETIAPLVFDAAVNPMILIADNRPATADDKIVLRVAGGESVVDADAGEFDLTQAPAAEFAYADVFTQDGRLLSKLHPQRHRIVKKMLRAEHTLADIARPYWVGKDDNDDAIWRDTPPEEESLSNGNGDKRPRPRWTQRRMLGYGATHRGKTQQAPDGKGWDYYKGENITACRVEGPPAYANALPDSLDSPGLWAYRDILPPSGYALMQIALGLTVARFNPQKIAIQDTTLIIPNEEWAAFPLDIALTSRLYQFFFANYLREGTLSHSWRSHIYPRTLEQLPLPPALLASSERLEQLRDNFLAQCKLLHQRGDALAGFLQEVETTTLQNACRQRNLYLKWSDGLMQGQAIAINAPELDALQPDGDTLRLGEEHWLQIDAPDLLQYLAAALVARHGDSLKRGQLLKHPIPATEQALAQFADKVRRYQSGEGDSELEKTLAEVDAIVGAAFGLTQADIRHVQKDMQTDAFLRRIAPRLPYLARRMRGISATLTSPERYK